MCSAPTCLTASHSASLPEGRTPADIKGKKGAPLGQEIMQNAAEGTIKETTYWWPRPGSDEPLEKHTFFTRVGDQDLWCRLLQAITCRGTALGSKPPTRSAAML